MSHPRKFDDAIMHDVCFELEARLSVEQIINSRLAAEAVENCRAAIRNSVTARRASEVSSVACSHACDELTLLDKFIDRAVLAFTVANAQRPSRGGQYAY